MTPTGFITNCTCACNSLGGAVCVFSASQSFCKMSTNNRVRKCNHTYIINHIRQRANFNSSNLHINNNGTNNETSSKADSRVGCLIQIVYKASLELWGYLNKTKGLKWDDFIKTLNWFKFNVCDVVVFIISLEIGKGCFVCAQIWEERKNTQIRDAGCHALAADIISQAFIVVFFRHQILQPLKRGLVLSTQKLWETEGGKRESTFVTKTISTFF